MQLASLSLASGGMSNAALAAKPRHESEVVASTQGRHGVFSEVEAARPDWDSSRQFRMTKTMNPKWSFGDGTNVPSSCPHVAIDPNGPGRTPGQNYRLLISGIIPRPIGFVSTASADGSSTNLAPYSWFQIVCDEPPVFVIGFAGGRDVDKDSLHNLRETGECVLNIISEDFIEAANACSMEIPYGKSEWSFTGLTPAETTHVRPKRVKESVFSIEAKLMNTQQFESRHTPGKKTATMAVVEGVNFWVREDAINEERTQIKPGLLRPLARLGGITYSRLGDGFELERFQLDDQLSKGKLKDESILPKINGQ